ncbi:transmembrane protein, putative [Bodo saltans]|uniref:Transmembrane protein, putative n=1 Tax=Bodo saltans TaxID=75058 RepID=A0A0S4IR24_BODSA|nr:transmembrane protein, putative [Bodo saltans]|eukprot:CUE99299.1 transmembrane protein, putative [Bodo saltans]
MSSPAFLGAFGSTESQYSYYEIFIHPFVRDAEIIIAATIGYFVVQFATMAMMPYISLAYRKLSKTDQQNFAIRVVSIVNGFVMFNSAFIFLDELRRNNWTLHDRHYEEIPGYRPYRLMIVGYFLWDLLVCVGYRWGAMWTIHAIVSFLGTYFLAFPFSDQYAAYYTGMFETSNAFIHSAALLKMLKIHLGLASLLEYIFAGLFFFIRVLGGTFVTLSWYVDMVPRLLAGRGHSHFTIAVCLLSVAVVMVLQYVWFWEIVKIATGRGDAPSVVSSDSNDDDKKATNGSSSTSATSPASTTTRRRGAAPKVE